MEIDIEVDLSGGCTGGETKLVSLECLSSRFLADMENSRNRGTGVGLVGFSPSTEFDLYQSTCRNGFAPDLEA